ncbi:unnamed protein product [Rotaria socialis]|uniref:Uncharacterized protein n=3 Tax=Rotaria socialis TaxID=392032 RepID=A0A820BNL6_9BILA|nr:unnamed protein product [Rotaria socialis]CAF4204282.1 unnamed protein product [Rotaria socialis]CAF4451920.1 unnamed protein product [Rotaria socialis]
MARISIVMFIQLAVCISISHAALTCYSCSNCGITWNDSKATIVQTSGSGDYCRKTVAGVVINRDFSSSCSSANVLGHGIFCCDTDLYHSKINDVQFAQNTEALTCFGMSFFAPTSATKDIHFDYNIDDDDEQVIMPGTSQYLIESLDDVVVSPRTQSLEQIVDNLSKQ